MYPWPTLYALPLRRRPGVFVPTMVARLFSSANADTISPALAVCSFTKSTTRPWNRCWPSPSVTTRIDFQRRHIEPLTIRESLCGTECVQVESVLHDDSRARDVS